MSRLIFLTISLCTLLALPSLSLATLPPQGNGTWIYDTFYDNQGRKIDYHAGLFANAIQNYNTQAQLSHTITQLFTYGGDMEMYCRGSGGSKKTDVCDTNNMFVFYNKEIGQASTIRYAQKLGDNISIIPIVDAQAIVAEGEEEYIKALNTLDRPTAQLYADKVAQLYCQDPHVAGIQFDIEPFDLNQPGQAYFYEQIAKDFANAPCVDATHPNGRFFSVFTFADHVDEKVAAIFNQYQNGYVVDSLYDLGPNPGGIASEPNLYASYVAIELQKMMDKAKALHIYYQLAIPAAASAHEFESKAGISTGFKQIDYVKAIFNTINQLRTREDNYFLGIDIWSWNHRLFWQDPLSGSTDEYTPAIPSTEMQIYLGNYL